MEPGLGARAAAARAPDEISRSVRCQRGAARGDHAGGARSEGKQPNARGQVIQLRGDDMLCTFPSVDAALGAAVAMRDLPYEPTLSMQRLCLEQSLLGAIRRRPMFPEELAARELPNRGPLCGKAEAFYPLFYDA
jgi:hypothetical protein